MPKSERPALSDPPLASLASHTEFCGGISKAKSGGGNEDLLPFCVNPAKGTDSKEAEWALSSAPVHPVFGQKHS